MKKGIFVATPAYGGMCYLPYVDGLLELQVPAFQQASNLTISTSAERRCHGHFKMSWRQLNRNVRFYGWVGCLFFLGLSVTQCRRTASERAGRLRRIHCPLQTDDPV
ncbi:hypothetical protein, partial [Burkholderia ubonensis]|uniref:hypothetical protein n=1 Tax=Burkholderia ubonensis TaxID=101571 RepID=UPI001E5D7EA5